MNTTTIELTIEGMTCSGCARGIENRLKQLEGVRDCAVSFEGGRARVSLDESRLSANEVVAAVEAAGYRVTGSERLHDGDDAPLFDLIIIGGGSAAFSAAIKAEELGLRTLMINGGLPFGGTCVNVGCVPSKYLIRAAEAAWHARHARFPAVQPKGVEVDFAQLIADKRALVSEMQQKKYMDVVADFQNLTLVTGHAELIDARTVVVDGAQRYRGLKILLATGARTNVPDIEGLEAVGYYTNRTLFELEELPPSMTVMGAGYIGLEIAQAWARLGSRVRIIEFTDRVLRREQPDVSAAVQAQFEAEGIEVLPNFRAFLFEKKDGITRIHCKCPDGSTTVLEEPGIVVVATGIRPNTEGLGAERVGLALDARGHIVVDANMRTNIPNIFAAGDVANTPAYVYTAAFEGKVAVENAFTSAGTAVDYSALPWVVFTDPQVAGVGMDEAGAEAAGIPYEVSKLPLSEVPRAIAANDTRGFIKLIRNPETDLLLGARIVAPEGGELVQMLSMAIRHHIPVSDLATSLYPYLTLSEGVKLAAITFGKDVRKLSCCAS